MRLSRAVPAGLLDAGCNSLATLAVGAYATRWLSPSDLGTYALFFNAFVLATVVPMQLVLVPAEIATLGAVPLRRLGLFRQVGRVGVPTAAAAATIASGMAAVLANADPAVLRPLALSTFLCAVVSPLQDHLRRLLHLGGKSGHAAGVSVFQLVSVIVALLGLKVLHVGPLWRPFTALALANIASIAAAVVVCRPLRVDSIDEQRLPQLVRSGRWLVGTEIATAGATLLSSALIAALASPAALGNAEAARIVGQPLFVMAGGLTAVIGPRLMKAGADRDRAAAARLSRPFVALILGTGALYGAVTITRWWGNPVGLVVPRAYAVPGLVPAMVAAFVLTGLPFAGRSELTGGGWLRGLPRIGVLAGAAQCAAALSAGWIGGFARPLSQGVFAVVLLGGYLRMRRAMYAAPPETAATAVGAGAGPDGPGITETVGAGDQRRQAVPRLASFGTGHPEVGPAVAAQRWHAEHDEGEGLFPSLWRRRWILAAALLTGLLGGAVLSAFQTDRYTATASVVLPRPQSAASAAGVQPDPGRQLRDETAIMLSTPVLDGVSARYGAGMTSGVAAARLRVSVSPESDVVAIHASGPTRASAERLAGALLDSYAHYTATAAAQQADEILRRLATERTRLSTRLARLAAQQARDPGDPAVGAEVEAVSAALRETFTDQLRREPTSAQADPNGATTTPSASGAGATQPAEVTSRLTQPMTRQSCLFGALLGLAVGAALAWRLDRRPGGGGRLARLGRAIAGRAARLATDAGFVETDPLTNPPRFGVARFAVGYGAVPDDPRGYPASRAGALAPGANGLGNGDPGGGRSGYHANGRGRDGLATGLATGRGAGPSRPFRWFTPALLVILTGYMFFSRSFAYVGVPGTPVFVGEMVLALGAFEAFRARRLLRETFVISPPFRALGAFVALCSLRLLVDLPTQRLGAVRDSALWYYSGFAFLVAAVALTDPTFVPRFARWFRFLIPLYLVWMPIAVIVAKNEALGKIMVLGSTTPINSFGGPNLSVLTAASMAFLWLGLERLAGRRPERRTHDLLAIVAVSGLLVLWSQSRGSLFAVVFVWGVALALVMPASRRRIATNAAGGLLVLVSFALVLNLHLSVGGRQLSVQQVAVNAVSLVDKNVAGPDEAQTGLEGTVSWRKQYFSKIIRDSLSWKHAFTGQGFGPVLSYEYARGQGQAAGATPLRNAHNSHITVLARVGLPGLGLWVLLWGSWFRYVARAARARKRPGADLTASVAAWTMAGVAGYLVFAMVDPSLEGPQGAVWAWTLMGLGAAQTAVWHQRTGAAGTAADPVGDPVADRAEGSGRPAAAPPRRLTGASLR